MQVRDRSLSFSGEGMEDIQEGGLKHSMLRGSGQGTEIRGLGVKSPANLFTTPFLP